MNALSVVVWSVLVPLAQKPPPASKVKPGWIWGVVVAALIVAVVFLYFSMRKQLRRVNFDEDEVNRDRVDREGGRRRDGDRGDGAPREDGPVRPS